LAPAAFFLGLGLGAAGLAASGWGSAVLSAWAAADSWWSANGEELQKRFAEWRGPMAPGQGKPAIVEAKPQDTEPPTQATP
jgi:hypothetical protein